MKITCIENHYSPSSWGNIHKGQEYEYVEMKIEHRSGARTRAHHGAAVRILRDFHVGDFFGHRQDLGLDEVAVFAGHRVVLEIALAAASIGAAGRN